MYHSTDGGGSFTRITNAPSINTMGFGKAAPDKNYPAIFITGTYRQHEGIFRSDDAGASWVSINSSRYQWGNRYTCITGDPRIFGRAYVGTDGRGIFYGDVGRF
jgi:photosystem II stability/assembly factor-like uncharacterized protein